MRALVQTLSAVNVVLFATLGVVTVRQWRARHDRVALWAALTFATLGVVVVLGRLFPTVPQTAADVVEQRVAVLVLLLFPFGLYRFTVAFRPAAQRLDRLLTGMTVAMMLWTIVLPHRFPAAGEPKPTWFWTYLLAFLVHWTAFSVIVTVRLWRAGREEPSVARRRMQVLAIATGAVTLAIFFSAAASDPYSGTAAIASALGLISAVCFLLGLAPPTIVRMSWRRPEQVRVQETIQDLMRLATSDVEVVDRVLEPFAGILGAQAVEIRNPEGAVLGRYVRVGDDDRGATLEVPAGEHTIVMRTSPYSPFFGSEEVALARTLGALTGLALDRGRLFHQEREARLAVERADRMKSDFVALAAHELRTPVTTIYGFVQTLNYRSEQLDEERKSQLRKELERQTIRMAGLVEQLLDLSRLDAEAIEIRPQRVDLTARLSELAASAAGPRSEEVDVRVPDGLDATVDPTVLERVVTNLITNAMRYGRAPFIVSAEQRDRHVRIAVEDRGEGVSDEFVPELFERFARSDSSRAIATGTGLGLAIAKSYARAHGGDLLYTPAQPRGARFELVLPAERG